MPCMSQSDLLTNAALILIGNQLPDLTILSVRTCAQLSYNGFSALARGCRNIQYLDVTYCELFCDQCMSIIAENCLELTNLGITETSVSDVGLSYLAEHISELRRIALDYSIITEGGLIRLIKGCTDLVAIQHDGRLIESASLLKLIVKRNIQMEVDWGDD